MRYHVSLVSEQTGKRRGLPIEADTPEVAERKARRPGYRIAEIRPEDFYDRLGARVRRAFTCHKCGGSKTLPAPGKCSRCRAAERKAYQLAAAKARAAARRERVSIPPVSFPDTRDGTVYVGQQRVPAVSIDAVEPHSNKSIWNELMGNLQYGWIVHCFHRGSWTVAFKTVGEAEAYYAYLCRNVPGLRVIRREEVWFWWVSF